MSETDTAIIQWAARHAPDVTDAEIAVSLGVSVNAVRATQAGITPEVTAGAKLRDYRVRIGRLADRLYEETRWTLEEVAEVAGCTRQHLQRCRKEAKRNG